MEAVRRTIFTVALVTALGAVGAAQTLILPPQERAKRDLKLYHGLILDYRAGRNAAVQELSSWEQGRILSVLPLIETADDDVRPWEKVRFKAAAMMHTDAALLLIDSAEPSGAALAQLDAASRVLAKAGPDIREYTIGWHVAVARFLRDRDHLAFAEQLLAVARERLPDSPALLYETGTLQELLATDTSLPRATPSRQVLPLRDDTSVEAAGPVTAEMVRRLERRRVLYLNASARWLRESIDRDPSSAPAHLHLGRVQALRNETADALRWLQQARASGDGDTAYLAALFIGALYERQQRVEEAEKAYRDAIGRQPLSQAPYVALSGILQRTGRGDEARAVLRRMTESAADDRREPWWWYYLEPRDAVAARLERLRREVRE